MRGQAPHIHLAFAALRLCCSSLVTVPQTRFQKTTLRRVAGQTGCALLVIGRRQAGRPPLLPPKRAGRRSEEHLPALGADGTPGRVAGGDACATLAEDQDAAGTMAQKVRPRLSHPFTTWLTRTYTFLPAGGTP